MTAADNAFDEYTYGDFDDQQSPVEFDGSFIQDPALQPMQMRREDNHLDYQNQVPAQFHQMMQQHPQQPMSMIHPQQQMMHPLSMQMQHPYPQHQMQPMMQQPKSMQAKKEPQTKRRNTSGAGASASIPSIAGTHSMAYVPAQQSTFAAQRKSTNHLLATIEANLCQSIMQSASNISIQADKPVAKAVLTKHLPRNSPQWQ